MDSGLKQTVDTINQTNLAITLFWVLTPIAILFFAIIVLIIHQRGLKCPKCGFWRKNIATMQLVTTNEGNKSVSVKQRVVVCKKCSNKFVVKEFVL